MSINDMILRFCSHCLEVRDQVENTEATKNSGCSRCSHCSQNNLQTQINLKKVRINIFEMLTICCEGIATNVQQVFDNLLSEEDKIDIINGDISAECLRAHIEVWVNQDMPYYAKKLSNNT